MKYQYSGRPARPENCAYLFSAVTNQFMNFLLPVACCRLRAALCAAPRRQGAPSPGKATRFPLPRPSADVTLIEHEGGVANISGPSTRNAPREPKIAEHG